MVRIFCLALVAAVGSVACGADVAIGQVSAAMKGTTVTLVGKAGGWKDSWKASAPNTFYLSDAAASIRVCIWPDDMAEVTPAVAQGLKTMGTPIRLTGEVDVFRDKAEIHVTNGSAVSLVALPGAAQAAATPIAVVPAVPQVQVNPPGAAGAVAPATTR